MMILTPLLAFALLGQTSTSPIRVAPETLAWLRRSGPGDIRVAEALAGKAATAVIVDPKESALLTRKDLRSKSLTDSRERAARQLRAGLVTPLSPMALLSVERKPMVRTTLTNGDALYDFTLTSGLLTPVSLAGEQLDEKDSAIRTLGKVVLARLRVPEAARSPVTGTIDRIGLPNGRHVWGGVLHFGHAPDANGVYQISDPKWYDHVNVWTDGRVMWIQYGRDDSVMRSANGNPSP